MNGDALPDRLWGAVAVLRTGSVGQRDEWIALLGEAAQEIERLRGIAYNVGLSIGCPTDHLDSWILKRGEIR